FTIDERLARVYRDRQVVYRDRRSLLMTLDEKLLREARTIRDKLIELQFEADRTQVAYQHSIRTLHAAGGSMREIADALGLSHQRVHQIVDAVAGKAAIKQSGRRRNKFKGDPSLQCSFCGSYQSDVPKLIAGPG